ncbi:MAG: cytochrome c peroxidase [Saprospiraceae bacterium]|nr:cytochrome c peroxidase [Saprospiraceae bacterium]
MQTNIIKMAPAMLLLAGFVACHDLPTEPIPEPGDLSAIPYDPQPYTIKKPDFFPNVPVPANNPMTVEGVQLGRRLFYDPILSADSTMSCASCHLPEGSFTDNKAVSTGIDGIAGRRSSMSLLNIAYANNGLFWDGRSATLEAQALLPVEDPIELHTTWPEVIEKLKTHPTYPAYFRKAFGINDRKEITKELAGKAMAQFERILISSGTSKFDLFLQTEDPDVFDEEELDGYLMYFEEAWRYGLNLPDAQCFHCHGGVTLTGNNYFNNGLDAVASLDDFVDKGRFEVTGNPSDRGKFRTPTMRNIALTAPYMHDGRFMTLEEVVENYARKGHGVANEDPNIPLVGLNAPNNTLSEAHKRALVKFLHTLTDTTFINNPDIQNPF